MKWFIAVFVLVIVIVQLAFSLLRSTELYASKCGSGEIVVKLTKEAKNFFELGVRKYLELSFRENNRERLIDRYGSDQPKGLMRLKTFGESKTDVSSNEKSSGQWEVLISSRFFSRAEADSVATCLAAAAPELNQELSKHNFEGVGPTLTETRVTVNSVNYFESVYSSADPDPDELEHSSLNPNNPYDFKVDPTKFLRIHADNSVWSHDGIQSRIGYVVLAPNIFHATVENRSKSQIQDFQLSLKTAVNSKGQKFSDLFKIEDFN